MLWLILTLQHVASFHGSLLLFQCPSRIMNQFQIKLPYTYAPSLKPSARLRMAIPEILAIAGPHAAILKGR